MFAEELFGLLLSHPDKEDFTCSPCRRHETEHSSLKEGLQSKLVDGLEEMLADLLSSSSTKHLLVCKVVRATKDLVTCGSYS